MDASAIDFVPWGLDAAWPARRWLEPIYPRRDGPPRGVRLGHASASAMVLTCTFPLDRFVAELAGTGADATRELAFETTFALINLALHQIRSPAERPVGLVGELVSYANHLADRHEDWAATPWGDKLARTTRLGAWQSGFSLDFPAACVIVHACGVDSAGLRLRPAEDLSGYELSADPLDAGAMHWELWPSQPELGYDDLARLLAAR
jgi:hypothetical protein